MLLVDLNVDVVAECFEVYGYFYHYPEIHSPDVATFLLRMERAGRIEKYRD